MQRFLQINHNLASIGKHQGDHAPRALVVDVSLCVIVDAVTTGFNAFEYTFRQIHEFRVVHYNFTMLLITQILVRTLALVASAVALAACGQQGPLYLPDTGGVHRATLPQSLLPGLGTDPTTTLPARPVSAPQLP